MFKFNIPLSIILSSGSLILLITGSLLLASNAAYTSDVQVIDAAHRSLDEQIKPETSTSSGVLADGELGKTNTAASNASAIADGRRRSGRLYNQSGYSNPAQQSLDNYAAAFAAASSPTSGDQSSSIQSSVQANDGSTFASFGEGPTASLGSPSANSNGRQLSSSDYGPHSSYYSSYMSPSSNTATFSSQQPASSNYHSSMHHYPHYPKSAPSAGPLPLGYPTNNYDRVTASNYYDRNYLGGSSSPFWASSGPTSTSSGLMSSASSALSHWTGGFGISEIICTLIAISIGAVILGAPFFLIYLALMGNFSSSGSITLTNPTGGTTPAGGASTTVNGRRKRLAIFEQLSTLGNQKHGSTDLSTLADSLVSQFSPFVDIDQMSSVFKRLVSSIEKYSNLKQEEPSRRKSF